MRIAEEGCSRKQLFHRCGRGRPKPHWTLSLTIKHEVGEIVEVHEFRAANKSEAVGKAFRRVQKRLGGLLLKDWQNPRLQAKISRLNGGSILGGIVFILQGRCRNYLGALKANGPQQMFKEANAGGGEKTCH